MSNLKSILKNTPHSSAAPNSQDAVNKRNMELALQHAYLIQHRKDVEAQVLTATESLLDFPTSSSCSAAAPSLTDSTNVKQLLKPFQPSDYDSLIEERNIDGKCGYVLCPLPHQSENTKAKYRMIHSSKVLKVIETAKLQKWCSNDCAERAMYIRVQLSEEPAWTRTELTGLDIELYGETELSNNTLRQLSPDVESGVTTLVSNLEKLAIERGQKNRADPSTDVTKFSLQEKDTSTEAPPEPPQLSEEVLDGYLDGRVVKSLDLMKIE